MSFQIITGDCRDVLKTLDESSIHCCVTSPPYFGLRDYGVEGQMGMERTPDEFVAALVEVFRDVRRALRDDGTLWLNLGDSYVGAGYSNNKNTGGASRENGGKQKHLMCYGLKHKDLIGIPWRVALALQADGWYLRQDIIWAKPNPMPESVTDRCTKAHEYLFLLSKGPRYYFDHESIKEPATGVSTGRAASFDRTGNAVADHVLPGQSAAQHRARPQQARAHELAKHGGLTDAHIAAIRAVGITDAGKAQVTQDGFGKNDPVVQALADEAKAVLGGYYREFLMSDTRNKRSVWTVATRPFKGAHFATFPPALIEPCILAGCPEGGTVLDPFGGACTTALVAESLGRDSVLIEMNPEYAALGFDRLLQRSKLKAAA